MLHDLWLMYLYCLLEVKELSWQKILPLFSIVLYLDPYRTEDLIAEIFMIEIWQDQQYLWALDNQTTRHARAITTLFILLIVQQRFAIYDRNTAIILWTIFCLHTLYKIILRFYSRGQLLYLNSLSVK